MEISATTSLKYRPEIDGLRAIAVLPVIFFHAGFSAFSGGYIGVDVFFVISGFLITSILANDIENQNFSLKNFYERRMRRILPALFLVSLVSVILGWLLMAPTDFAELAGSLVAVALFASNIFFWQESDYFDTTAELQPLLHTWSLAVEEQFYVFYPILLFAIWRFGQKKLFLILSIILLISLTLAQYAAGEFQSANFYLLPTRAWELMLGALTALLLRYKTADFATRTQREWASWIGLLLILISVFTFNKNTPTPSLYTLIPTVGTALLIYFLDSEAKVARFLSNRIFVGLGLISYSAYLWHQPVFAFARYRTIGELSSVSYIILIALVLLLAFLSWQLVEKPFRDRSKVKAKFVLIFSAVGSLLLVLVGISLPAFRESQDNGQKNSIYSTIESSPKREQCHFPQAAEALTRLPCTYFANLAQVAVIGNSHAVELSYSLAKYLKPQRVGITQYTISGCKHNYRVVSEINSICGKWHEKVIDEVNDNSDIKSVVLSYRNDSYISEEIYQIALVNMVNEFIAANKEVILVLQAPSLKAKINQYLAVAETSQMSDIPGKLRREWSAEYLSKVNFRSLLPTEVQIVDPANQFCNQEFCFVTKKGLGLYFDDHHMSLSGSDLLVEQIDQFLSKK